MICPHCHTALRPVRSARGGEMICPGCQRTFRTAAKVTSAAPEAARGSPAPARATSATSSTRWYLRQGDGESVGPLSKDQLDRLAHACELNSTTQVWQEGWPQAIWAAQLYPWVADVVPVLPDAGVSSASAHGVFQDPWQPAASRELAKSPPAWALAIFVAVTAVGAFVMFGLTLALRCPAKPTLMAVGAFVGGMFAIGGAIFDWSWFWSHRKSARLRSLLGPTASRLLYAGLGGFLIFCALGIALQNGQAGATGPTPRTMRRPSGRPQRIPIEFGRR